MADDASIDLVNVDQHPYREIIRLAGPMVLSMTGVMIMQVIDGIFLSWYSEESLAALGNAGLASYMLLSPFIATAGYSASIISQYIGAGKPNRAGATVWQSVYFSLIGGILLVVAGRFGSSIFTLAGHAAPLADQEAIFFRISCYGGIFALLGSSLGSFFSARGDVRTLMAVQLSGLGVNALLAYLLIFGHAGFPRMGIAGGALATVSAQFLVTAVLAGLFLGSRHFRESFSTWRNRGFDLHLFRKLISFGLPSGMRHLAEMAGASVFLFYIGRIGTEQLAASTIGWRINGLAFFPLIGLGQAIGTIVGHAQGEGNHRLSSKIVIRGIIIAEIWMLICGLLFVLFPAQLFSVFQSSDAASGIQHEVLRETTFMILRFVAVYCLVDAGNIIFAFALQYAGDTRWTFWAVLILNGLLVAAMGVADALHGGVYAQWTIFTALTMLMALTWALRFAGGKWKSISLVEPVAQLEDESRQGR